MSNTHACDVLAIKKHLARCCFELAGYQIEVSCLAGPIWTDNSCERAWLKCTTNAVYCYVAAETARQLLRFYRGPAHFRHLWSRPLCTELHKIKPRMRDCKYI